MFVALRQMKEQLPSGQVVDLFPGDPVTTFESWPYTNKVSAISFRLVAQVADGEQPDATALLAAGPNSQVRQAIAEQHGWGDRTRTPVQHVPKQPERVAAPAPLADVPADPNAATTDEELAKALGIQSHACDACAYVANSSAGLKTHKTRLHKAK